MPGATKNCPIGPAGWGICITCAKGVVEIAITGPEGGHYPSDFGTPEQIDEIALELVRSANEAREKAAEKLAA